MKRRWREERAGERVQEGIETVCLLTVITLYQQLLQLAMTKKMDEDPLEPLLTLGRRVDVSVAECFYRDK